MKKIKVTQEEKNALDEFLKMTLDYQQKVRHYIVYNGSWTNTYLPLKSMGLEKFVKCLTFGYELEMPIPDAPKYFKNGIDISYNKTNSDLLNCPGREIYINIRNVGADVSEAKIIHATLGDIINHYETYVKPNVKY